MRLTLLYIWRSWSVEGAAAALKTAALMEVHTEKGALAEKACVFFIDFGLSPSQLVLCHMDKRPDIGLHKELAHLGVLLEYDTFYRPKYNPSVNLWPLTEQMVSAGFADRVALATTWPNQNFITTSEVALVWQVFLEKSGIN